MTEKKFSNILKNQISDKEKRKRADFIVNFGNWPTDLQETKYIILY